MLTTETHAPYNRSDMSVDDPALDAAIRRHEERLARDPASLAFAQLADLYRKAGRTREAVALCRNGLARYPHYTTARLILAKTLAAEGALDAALAEIGAILEQGCVEEAAQAFTRILRKDPDNHAARERLETTLHARARRKG